MGQVTADELREHLGSNVPLERLEPFVEGAEGWLLTRLGRTYEGAVSATERYRGTGTDRLVLKRTPVVAVSAVTVKGIALDVDEDIDIENERAGLLVRLSGTWPDANGRPIAVTYTAGEEMPVAVRQAILEAAAHVFQTTGGRGSVSDGGSSVSFAGGTLEELKLVQAVIDRYGDVLA